MRNWIKRLFGEIGYCRFFHTRYGIKNTNLQHCDKCNLTYENKLSDDYLGPM